MNCLITTLLIAALSLAGSPNSPAVDWSADVQLTLDDESVLPATPTGITVTIANRGKSSIRLPSLLWIVASTEDGRSFPLRNLMEVRGEPVPEDIRVIPPGTSRELRFDPSEVVQGTRWVLDERIVVPGRYDLRAIFAESIDSDGRFDVANALFSKPAAHVVEQPSTEDAAVWSWMQKTAGGPWGEKAWFKQPGLLADFVLEEHPQSRYALYAAIWASCRDLDKKNELLERMIAEHPTRGYTEQLILALARRYESEYSRAYQAGDMVRAAAQLSKARALIEPLQHDARSSIARSHAARMMHQLPHPEDLASRTKERE